MSHPILETATRRAFLLDGAMGTEIQKRALTTADYDGRDGCNELLVLTRPDVILDIHRSYYAAGADAVETDSFGSNAIVLREYGLEGRVRELNAAAARLARQAADAFATPDRPRWVSGSVGPGTKLPSLGQVTFAELYAAFREQAEGLLEGGVDLFQVETCQDPLQSKAAILAVSEAAAAAGRRVPVLCTLTFEPRGTLLLGTEPLAAVTTLARLPGIDALGLNCATGPDSMYPILAELARTCPLPLAVLPNAGLPELVDGKLAYRLSPAEFAAHVTRFVREFGVAFAGGCCGTTPDHIAALAAAVAGVVPARRDVEAPPMASSLFSAASLVQEPRPLIIGERTNANGSKEFRERIVAGDVEGMVAVARGQAEEGAHLLDVCVALAGRDEKADALPFLEAARGMISLPLVYDSTEPDAIEAALEAWPGRAVVNSVNLEDGGTRLDRIAAIARRHGAALVALTIDEAGMAMTVDAKVDIAKRLVDRLCGRHGFAPSDLLIDPLTFTLGSGDPSLRDAGVRTLTAIRRIKAECPGVLTSLGVSNASFGLKPAARRVLNSVFLHYALDAGLDAAILNAGRIVPYADIPDDLRAIAEDLVFDRREKGDPLEAFLVAFEGAQAAEVSAPRETLPPDERIRRRVIAGDRPGIEADLDEAVATTPPLDLINGVLMEAMKTVGERFGRGETQLPFVLKSAEVMKAAVRHLEPLMPRGGGRDRGTLVIATVAGDVHDIGKNLVQIVLENNGWRVVDLGTRQPIEAILEAAAREKADAIGMSGLLVKSTVVMRENLIEMKRRGLTTPVLLGGAALTRRFVLDDCAPIAAGPVFYCRDAFEGLSAMERVMSGDLPAVPVPGGVPPSAASSSPVPPAAPAIVASAPEAPAPADGPLWLDPPPVPPFLGTRVIAELPVAESAAHIDRVSLFRGRWQYRRGGLSEEDWRVHAAAELEPILQDRLARWSSDGTIRLSAIWGFLPANGDGNSVVVFGEDGRTEVARLDFPRRTTAPHLCLADYLLPLSSGRRDVLGLQIVTTGPGVPATGKVLRDRDAYTEYLYLHGLATELAEASAEAIHRRIREALRIDPPAVPGDPPLRRYQGRRYSFGYPACPRIEDQAVLLRLLGAERIGVTLTEQFQMVPELSTSAIVFASPHARWFGLS